MCFDKRVIAGLAVVALAVFVFAPGALTGALPLLVVAACPLSMLVMMRAMSGPGASCATAARTSSTAAADDEVAELRAELARLRATRARRSGSPVADHDTEEAEAAAGDR